ncbi:MAG: ribonuclease P protein component [Burkholderiales bacterium]|nr:ribonuclease P protein component [Burkholderiales bacterium]
MSNVRATLPRTARLRGPTQFTGAFQQRYRSRHFLLLIRPGGSIEGSARLGIVIGRKQIAGAAGRARMRRIIREVFRFRRHQLGQIDMVVRYLATDGRCTDVAIRSELNELFARATA